MLDMTVVHYFLFLHMHGYCYPHEASCFPCTAASNQRCNAHFSPSYSCQCLHSKASKLRFLAAVSYMLCQHLNHVSKPARHQQPTLTCSPFQRPSPLCFRQQASMHPIHHCTRHALSCGRFSTMRNKANTEQHLACKCIVAKGKKYSTGKLQTQHTRGRTAAKKHETAPRPLSPALLQVQTGLGDCSRRNTEPIRSNTQTLCTA